MITAPCPKCGERNPADAMQCVRCAASLTGTSPTEGSGSDLSGAVPAGPGLYPLERLPVSTYSPSGDAAAGYPVLRRMRFVCSLLGLVFLLAGWLTAVAVFLRFGPPDLLPRLQICGVSVLVGVLLYLALNVAAETIILLLDVETSTRRSARLLEDLVRRGTGAQPAPASASPKRPATRPHTRDGGA